MSQTKNGSTTLDSGVRSSGNPDKVNAFLQELKEPKDVEPEKNRQQSFDNFFGKPEKDYYREGVAWFDTKGVKVVIRLVETNGEEAPQVNIFMGNEKKIVKNGGTNNFSFEEAKELLEKHSFRKKTDLPARSRPKIYETKRTFFNKYEGYLQEAFYMNKKNGQEIQILDFNPKTKKVTVKFYNNFQVNEEKDGKKKFEIKNQEERGNEKEMDLKEFEEMMKDYVSTDEMDNQEGEKNNIEIVNGVYMNKGKNIKLAVKIYKRGERVAGTKYTVKPGTFSVSLNGKFQGFWTAEKLEKYIEKNNLKYSSESRTDEGRNGTTKETQPTKELNLVLVENGQNEREKNEGLLYMKPGNETNNAIDLKENSDGSWEQNKENIENKLKALDDAQGKWEDANKQLLEAKKEAKKKKLELKNLKKQNKKLGIDANIQELEREYKSSREKIKEAEEKIKNEHGEFAKRFDSYHNSLKESRGMSYEENFGNAMADLKKREKKVMDAKLLAMDKKERGLIMKTLTSLGNNWNKLSKREKVGISVVLGMGAAAMFPIGGAVSLGTVLGVGAKRVLRPLLVSAATAGFSSLVVEGRKKKDIEKTVEKLKSGLVEKNLHNMIKKNEKWDKIRKRLGVAVVGATGGAMSLYDNWDSMMEMIKGENLSDGSGEMPDESNHKGKAKDFAGDKWDAADMYPKGIINKEGLDQADMYPKKLSDTEGGNNVEKKPSIITKTPKQEFKMVKQLDKGGTVWGTLKENMGWTDNKIANELVDFKKEMASNLTKKYGMSSNEAKEYMEWKFRHMQPGDEVLIDKNNNISIKGFDDQKMIDKFKVSELANNLKSEVVVESIAPKSDSVESYEPLVSPSQDDIEKAEKINATENAQNNAEAMAKNNRGEEIFKNNMEEFSKDRYLGLKNLNNPEWQEFLANQTPDDLKSILNEASSAVEGGDPAGFATRYGIDLPTAERLNEFLLKQYKDLILNNDNVHSLLKDFFANNKFNI